MHTLICFIHYRLDVCLYVSHLSFVLPFPGITRCLFLCQTHLQGLNNSQSTSHAKTLKMPLCLIFSLYSHSFLGPFLLLYIIKHKNSTKKLTQEENKPNAP